MNIERLLKAAETLNRVQDSGLLFDADGLGVDAEGYLSQDPWHQAQGLTFEKVSVVFNGLRSEEAISAYFGISEDQVEYLFYSDRYVPEGRVEVTRYFKDTSFGWSHEVDDVTAGQYAKRFAEFAAGHTTPMPLAA